MDKQQLPEVYRPTVRYDPIYQEYVNRLFHATRLDRNEIIRLALFSAPLSALFRSKIEVHLKDGQDFPKAPWASQDKHLWKAGEYAADKS